MPKPALFPETAQPPQNRKVPVPVPASSVAFPTPFVCHGPKPYEFIGFGALHGSKPYEFIRFGALHGPKPYEFIVFGALHDPKPYALDDAGLEETSLISSGKANPHSDAMFELVLRGCRISQGTGALPDYRLL